MWRSFAEGHANSVVVMAPAIAVIATREARSLAPAMPAWAARTGAALTRRPAVATRRAERPAAAPDRLARELTS